MSRQIQIAVIWPQGIFEGIGTNQKLRVRCAVRDSTGVTDAQTELLFWHGTNQLQFAFANMTGAVDIRVYAHDVEPELPSAFHPMKAMTMTESMDQITISLNNWAITGTA
jgi:hypothetical protein